MSEQRIFFNRPHITGNELHYIAEAHRNAQLAGDGPFTARCHALLEKITGSSKALLTHSCTAALEMTALLLDIKPGDEIIMPSYTFVSTANAFVMRGGIPVFIDIHANTLNIDESLIEAAITTKTRAITVVHYAGVGCEMDKILAVANAHGLPVIEDAAQGFMATYKGKSLGSIGTLGTLSFHETKNVISGEGGALLINDPVYKNNAEIIREKGTDRSKFFRGEVDKYTWQTVGSSYLPGELIAAFLWAQLEQAESITAQRMKIWQYYHKLCAPLEECGLLTRPFIPHDRQHNAHMYYVVLPAHISRQSVLEQLKARGINAVFHYVPLHNSPAGLRYGRTGGTLPVTLDISERIIRLPLWVGLQPEKIEQVTETLSSILMNNGL